MCGGEGTAMCGELQVAAECTCTEREFGRCSHPTVRPGRNVNDERDHGDGSDTRPRGRRTSGSLTETRDWQYLPERFDGSANRNMNPCSLDGTDQLARTVLAACVDPDGPVGADGEQALVHLRCAQAWPFCQVARLHGRGTRPLGRECDGHAAAGARGRGSWPPSPMIPTWPGWSTVSRPRMGSSHRVREKPPARRPRVVVEEPAQSRPAPAAAGGARWGRRLSWRAASPGC